MPTANLNRPPGEQASEGSSRWVLRWWSPCLVALLLSGMVLVREQWVPLRVLPKGSTAAFTVRATHDAVYDLHETVADEAEEARQSYLPIYEKDNTIFYEARSRILDAAQAEPLDRWAWPASMVPPAPDGGLASAPGTETSKAADLGGPADLPRPDRGRRRLKRRVPDARASSSDHGSALEAGLPEAGPRAIAPSPVAGSSPPVSRRRDELKALVLGSFRILEPLYKDGVVADSEFPREKSTVRILSRGTYHLRPASSLVRFTHLGPHLEQAAAQFFFKSEPRLRQQVAAFILERLPPNLVYAAENRRFITDISQVTGVRMMLIRRGEVLVRRGQVVDTRAYYAIKAAVLAASAEAGLGHHLARTLLLWAMLLLFVVSTREVCTAEFRSLRGYIVHYFGLVLLAALGAVLLTFLPMHAAAMPQAALALCIAVVMGRGPGLLGGILVPFVLIMVQVFDLPTLLVGVSGGITAALTVRRRRRTSVLPAAVLVGLVQALVFEACRAAEGRPRTYEELWAAAEAFIGGLASGLLALPALPFVERILGRSSRGKLKLLTDFDNPLVRRLREEAPGTFAHTVNLVNMVEPAVESVGGDRLLARAGTLFHDIGKMIHPENFVENQGLGPNIHDTLPPDESARRIVAHVKDGLELARRHHLPPDVAAFIPEHHGTTGAAFFLHKAREQGLDLDLKDFHYPGPKPQSVETAVLMIADSVEAASRTLEEPTPEALAALVDQVVFKKFSEYQFEECGITQGQLKATKAAFVAYLKGALHRRVAYPPMPKPT